MLDILSGEWRKLIMANYIVPARILRKYLPHGTHLCPYNGEHFVTLAGFMFSNIRVRGIKIPFNHTFEEINLRFYVEKDNTLEKGVVFIKEIVRKPLFGLAINLLAGENYVIYPTDHEFARVNGSTSFCYQWKYKGLHTMEAQVMNSLRPYKQNSEEEYILKNHWSFTRVCANLTSSFYVSHPEWLVYPIKDCSINVDFKQLYGKKFGFLSDAIPHSVQVAEGSPIVMKKAKNF